MNTTGSALREKSKEHKERSFNEFLAKPATKLVLSLIPAGNNEDAMRTLLAECFDSGFNAGMSDALGHMVDAMLKAPRGPAT